MKSPMITVIGSLSFASGCFVVATNVEKLTAGSELILPHSQSPPTAQMLLASQIQTCLALYWPALFLVAATGYSIAWLSGRNNFARLLAVLPLISMIYALVRLPTPKADDLLYVNCRNNVQVIVKVESIRGENTLICRAVELRRPFKRVLTGRTVATIYGARNNMPYESGQVLSISGKVQPLASEKVTWLRQPNKNLACQGIFSRLATDARHIEILNKTADRVDDTKSISRTVSEAWQSFWEHGRQEIIKAHANSLGQEKGDLLSSMVLGDRVVRLPKQLKQLFRDVGLSHLLAASGFNLSIVVASSYCIARLLPIPVYWASLCALMSTVSFVCLAGPSPSVVRAALLCVLFLLVRLSSRRLHGLAALSLTLLVATLFDPLCVADIGLQLSYLATAGIICGCQFLDKERDKARGAIEIARQWLKDTVAVICLAQLSVLPLQLVYFGTAGLLFLPANLMVDPVVAPVTVLGFISSMMAFSLSLLPIGITCGSTLIATIDKLASLPLEYMIQCATSLSSFKSTNVRLGPAMPFAITIYYLCFSYFLYVLPKKNIRSLGWISLLIGLCIMLFRPNIPDEIICFSKRTTLSINNKQAFNLSGETPDWLSKQVLAYTACDLQARVSKPRILELDDTTIVITQSKNFSIVSTATEESLRDSDKPCLEPLSYKETASFLRAVMDNRCPLKHPTLIWSMSRNPIRAVRKLPGVYITGCASGKILLFARAPNHSRTRRTEFYPFTIERQSGELLLLR